MAFSPDTAILSSAAVAPTSGSAHRIVAPHASVRMIDGTSANESRKKKRRPRNPTRFM
jgi:hypothetical protein